MGTQYIYYNNGLSYRLEQAVYTPIGGEQAFSDIQNSTALASAFAGYTVALSMQNAVDDLETKLAAGIAITSTGTSAWNATYALDDITLSQIKGVANDASSGMGLPGGGGIFTYPDITGTPHDFTSAGIIDLYKAMRDLMLLLQQQSAIQAAGGTPTWPSQAVTIA